MAMDRLTITGEWGVDDRQLLRAEAACEFAAEHSVAALDVARALVAALLGPDDARGGHPVGFPLWRPLDLPRPLCGVLAVSLRYREDHDRMPVGLHWITDESLNGEE
ncbi:MAG: hypothetical protein ACR2JW_08205 [Thermomicrobiales bacterium]